LPSRCGRATASASGPTSATSTSLGESARGFLDAAGLADRAGELVADLSHGEQKQLELAVALATKPRLLLLDEPMAGLGHVESQQMIEMLRGLKEPGLDAARRA
jgi:ABC-type branched-subunit amino acid transport system ATPase component